MWSFQQRRSKPQTQFKSANEIFNHLSSMGVIKQKNGSHGLNYNPVTIEEKQVPSKSSETEVDSQLPSETQNECQGDLMHDERQSQISDETPVDYLDDSKDEDWLPDVKEVSTSEEEEEKSEGESIVADSEEDADSVTYPLDLQKLSSLSSPDQDLNNYTMCYTNPITVMKFIKKGKKTWDKRHYCLFCEKLYAKLPRHFEQVHNNELEVAAILALPKCSKERKSRWNELKHKGDFIFNTKVMNKGEGQLIPARRPTDDVDFSSYASCDKCLGLFAKKDLWRHRKKCKILEEGNAKGKNVNLLCLSKEHQDDNDFSAKILNTMLNDIVSWTVRNDPLICRFGRVLFVKCSQQPHQHQYVKQKLREMGKLVLQFKELTVNSATLKDCLEPIHFSSVIKAVKIVCRYNDKAKYGIPSLALKIGHSLKKCASIQRSLAIQAGDEDLKQKACDFLLLYSSDWAHEISSLALQTLETHHYNAPKRIPLAEDIKKLNVYLQGRAADFIAELKACPSPVKWRALAEVSLAQIVLFNRRRAGEAQRIELAQYNEGLLHGKTLQGEILNSLDEFEKHLAKTLHRIEIRGKRGRRVPVLLTPAHKEVIDTLIAFRSASGVPDDAIYIFASSGQAPIRSADVLRKFAAECGAVCPGLLTSTALRKHIGTISQLFNLKRNELDSLATFMGHDISVHRNFYRLPDDTVQVAKVSKILLQLEKGQAQKFQGKSLDEMTLNADEEIGSCELETSAAEDDEDSDTEISTSKEPESFKSLEVKTNPKKVKANKMPMQNLKHTRIPWSQAEKKNAIRRQLGKYFVLQRLPGKAACVEAQQKETVLQHRPWSQLKFYIKNAQVSKVTKNT